MSFFDAAFAIVVDEEGGYSNDPNDPGGETRWGISKRAYPNVDLAKLTLSEAQDIYKRDYWDRLNCDALSWELALITFDAAVNQGPSFAQGIKGTSIDIMAERAMRYAHNKNVDLYGKGWFRRLFTIFKKAQALP